MPRVKAETINHFYCELTQGEKAQVLGQVTLKRWFDQRNGEPQRPGAYTTFAQQRTVAFLNKRNKDLCFDLDG
jgi:hypothetical protein